MTKTKKLLTAALAVAALGTASIAASADAFAKRRAWRRLRRRFHGGGKFFHGGGRHFGHRWHGHHRHRWHFNGSTATAMPTTPAGSTPRTAS